MQTATDNEHAAQMRQPTINLSDKILTELNVFPRDSGGLPLNNVFKVYSENLFTEIKSSWGCLCCLKPQISTCWVLIGSDFLTAKQSAEIERNGQTSQLQT